MADAREPEEGGSDLFDRWLSHRQKSTGDDPRPRTYGVPRTGLPGAGPEDGPADATRPDVDEDRAVSSEAGPEPDVTEPPVTGAPVSEAAVGEDPGSEAAVGEAPAPGAVASGPPAGKSPETGLPGTGHAETERPETEPPATGLPVAGIDSAGAPAVEDTADPQDATSAPAPPARRAPVGLDEFEPVVIASVRRSAETPVEKRSRLARFRRAGLEPDPADGIADDEIAADDEPDEREPAHDQPAEHEAPHDEPADVVPTHEATGDQPNAVPEPEAAGEVHLGRDTPARQQDAAAAVFAAFNPGAAPSPDASTPPTSDSATETAPAAPHQAAPRPPVAAPTPAPATHRSTERRRARPSLAAYVEAARTTLDRSVHGTPEERVPTAPVAAPEAPPEQPAAREAAEATPATEAAPTRSAYDELRARREAAAPPAPDVLPPSIDFRPRTLARRVTSVLLLVGLVATGVAAWRAYESRVETDIGLAAILALVTGVVWAVRAGSVPTRIGLHGGVLEVRSQAGRFVFEVTGAHTQLEVIGTPGRRGSRLLVHRRGLAPFALTPAMVDLRTLVEALRYYRPDL